MDLVTHFEKLLTGQLSNNPWIVTRNGNTLEAVSYAPNTRSRYYVIAKVGSLIMHSAEDSHKADKAFMTGATKRARRAFSKAMWRRHRAALDKSALDFRLRAGLASKVEVVEDALEHNDI